MSIQEEINRIEQNVANTYTALSEMGATMPAEQNSNNLASTARTVPQSGGGGGEAVQEIFYVDGTFDMSTFTFATDVTFEEIASQAVLGKEAKARARVEVGGYLVQIIYLSISIVNVYRTVANFEGTMQVEGRDLGFSSGRILLAVSVEISTTDIRTKIRVLSATDIT